MRTSFLLKNIIFIIFIGSFCSIYAQNLPLTINSSSNLSQSWITPYSNGFNTAWENAGGTTCTQLYKDNGGMVVAFNGIPSAFMVVIHRYREAGVCGWIYPKVYIDASADNSSWHQVGFLDEFQTTNTTLHINDNIQGALASSDRYLRIRRSPSTGSCVGTHWDGFAYLVSLSINGYVPTGIVLDYQNVAGNYQVNLPCVATNVFAEIWGAGGGGGSATASWSGTATGGGGGGGGYIKGNFGNIGGNNLSIVIGGGGGNNSDGNDSKVSYNTSNYIQANKGTKGGSASRSIAGHTAGSVGTGGSYANGGNVTVDNSASGSNGFQGNSGSLNGTGGNGGQGANSGGAGGSGVTNNSGQNAAGGNGYAPGGGGAGGGLYKSGSSSATANGGTGGNGTARVAFDLAIPNITLTNGALTFCEGGSTTLTASVCSTGGSVSYQWYRNGTAYATGASVPVSQSGDYYVVVTLSYTEAQLKTLLDFTGLLIAPSLSTSKMSDIVTVTVNQPTSSVINATICEGTNYNLNGFNVSTAGTYSRDTINSAGCDSTITLELSVNPAPSLTVLTAETCEQDAVIWFSFTGKPNFTLDYTVDVECVGINLDPSVVGFPTTFGSGYIDLWSGSGNTWSAGINVSTSGQYVFHFVELTDGNGCKFPTN